MTTEMSTAVISIVRAGRITAAGRAFGAPRIVGRRVPRRSRFGDAHRDFLSLATVGSFEPTANSDCSASHCWRLVTGSEKCVAQRVGRADSGAAVAGSGSSLAEGGKDLYGSGAAPRRWRSHQLNLSAVQDQHLSLQHARTETRSLRRREQFDANRVAGIGRPCEPHRHRFERFRTTRREMLKRSAAHEPECVQSVRNRTLEAGVSRNVGVGVDRYIVPARLPVEESRLARRSVLDDDSWFAIRFQRPRQSRWRAETATAPIVPQKLRGPQAGQRFAAVCIRKFLRGVDERAPRGPLVLDGHNCVMAAHYRLDRQRAVQRKVLLAVQDPPPGDLRSLLFVPEWRPAEHHALAWNRAQSMTLIDEGQFVLVKRVLAHSEAQRVERGVARVVALDDRLKAKLAHELEIHRLRS